MCNAKVIEVFRKQSQQIYGYRIQDINTKEIKDVEPDRLKAAVKNNKIILSNYKLTSDNRLIKSSNSFTPNVKGVYYLMNKNNIVLEFDITFGPIKTSGRLPYNFDTITEWIADRTKFSCAHDAKKFFKSIGINDSEQFIEITHCVSLQDTFWIKSKDSHLKWENVSPFRHNYSDVISTYALEGIFIGNNEKSYFSPVVSTNGSFPHTWKFSNHTIKFVKAGSKYTLGGSNSGREPFSEYYASIVADYLHFDHVKYTIRNHKRHDNKMDVVTECNCFTTENIGTVTAHDLKLESYEKVLEYCGELSPNAVKTFVDMLFLDCLLLNTDRHFSNIEFFVNNDTLEVLDIVPIFDNNYALLPRFIEGYDTFKRDEYTVRDNRTFQELYDLVKKNRDYTGELIRLKNLKLTEPEGVEISAERLGFLNSFLQMQVKYLLES